MKTQTDVMLDLVHKLNYYTKKYDEGCPEISDKEWDNLYFQLQDMEKELGIYYKDSPTRTINYQVVNQLNKVKHNHKMLSLEKTKSLDDVKSFIDDQFVMVMPKIDGLTCSLKYINGRLISAETRGDGVIGEDVLHNALTIRSIPRRINYTEELIVDGEIVCLYKDLTKFMDEYKNPRNFASGSIRLLDSKECEKRCLTFIAWEVIKGFEEKDSFTSKLNALEDLGFFIVPYVGINSEYLDLEYTVERIKTEASLLSIPIDGVVFKFNNLIYSRAQGETSHHLKNALAYKFYDEIYKTTLRDIEWTMGRTGVLTPVAIFDSINIEGSIVERASLHNLSILKNTLNVPWRGQTIGVYKANMIIPQIGWADKETVPNDENILLPPWQCPICERLLEQRYNNNSLFLICNNDDCEGKLINRLEHFCGKKGLDIKGLSSATLKKLIDWGWINNIIDIYSLKNYKKEWIQQIGFGKKSVENILQAIEDSKECSLEAFISSLGIPLIGKNVSADLIKYFTTYEAFREAIINKYDFSQLEGFAESKTNALLNFDYTEADQIAKLLNIKEIETQENNLSLEGKKYVITGTVKQFKNRAELQSFIETRGGKVVSAISKNVDYLINNNAASTSAKNVAAKKMGIPIITEAEFLEELN